MAIDLKSINKKKAAAIAISVVAGLVAVALTQGYIQRKANEIGSTFADKHLKSLKKQISTLGEQDRHLQKKILSIGKEVRAIPKQTVQREPPRSRMGSLSVVTPPGLRAITVQVSRMWAVGGQVMPGDNVDIIAHLSVPVDPDDPKTKETIPITLFQNVPVLSVDGIISPDKMSKASKKSKKIPITFALNPKEAGLLTFAEQNGRLQLILRSPLDSQAYMLPTTSWDVVSDFILDTQGVDIGYAKKEQKKGEPLRKKEPPLPPGRSKNIEVFKRSHYKGLQ